MKKRIDQKIIIMIGVALISILSIVGAFMRFSQAYYEKEIQNKREDLIEVAKNGTLEAKDKLNDSIDLLQVTASTFTDMKSIDDKGVVSVLSYLNAMSTFDLIAVADVNGKSINDLGQVRDVSDREYYHEAIKNKVVISDIMTSKVEPNEEIIVLAVPLLTQQKEVNGVVFGVYSLETISNYLNNNTVNQSYVLIIDSEGNYITRNKTKDSLMESNNVWKDISRYYLYDTTANEVQQHVKKQETGTFNFRYKNEERFTYYSPLGVNNWYILSTTNLLYLEQSVDSITDTVFILSMVIVFAALCVIVAFIWYNRKVNLEIRQARDESLSSEEFLRLAISQTDLIVFEYDYRTKKLRLKNDKSDGVVTADDLGILLNSTDELSHVDKKYERRFLQMFQRIENEAMSEDVIKMHFQGKIYWYHMTLQNIYNDDHEIINTVVCVEDVTEIETHKQQLSEKQQVEDAMYADTLMKIKVDLEKNKVIELNKEEVNQKYNEFVDDFVLRHVDEVSRNEVIKKLSAQQLIYEFQCGKEVVEFQFIMCVDHDKLWVSCKIYLLSNSKNKTHAIITLSDINAQKQKELEIQRRAEYDGLTSLYNAFTLKAKMNEYLLKEANLNESNQVFMLLDLDNFKSINDTFGHQAGDQVLKDVAKVLNHRFRSDDIVGRLGGDEFAILLKNVSYLNSLDKICIDLIEDIRHTYEQEGVKITVSASVGVAIAPMHGDTFEDLYGKSDLALYEVKRDSKDNYKVYRASEFIHH